MKSSAEVFKEYLTDQLQAGTFGAGARLPPERRWADKFGISRGTVRRVLKTLEEDGRIERVMGSGTFVLPGTGSGSKKAAPVYASPSELLEARLYIEPIMPELIVRNARTQDFERMEECLDQAEASSTIEQFEDLDEQLHQLFAAATHNPFFVRVMELVSCARKKGDWGVLKQRTYTKQRHRQYMAQHRQIVEALKSRDLPLSKKLMTEHLLTIRENLFGGAV